MVFLGGRHGYAGLLNCLLLLFESVADPWLVLKYVSALLSVLKGLARIGHRIGTSG